MSTSAVRTGELALALVATVHQRRGAATELLATPEEVVEWCEAMGLPAPHPTPAEMQHRLRALREAIHRLATTDDWAGAPAATAALDLVNEAAAAAVPPALTLDRATTADRIDDGLATIGAIALDAIALFSSCSPDQIRECANEPCTTLFVDRSQAQRRRWCSMRTCGNRAHVAAHRRRRAGGG
ncbi:MAG: CGNR zinc finger domain-containing protein [Actinomycetota bacterium]